ncbi:MAG: glutamate--tRNA ligase [Candidatus Buchananbacteria bacterium]
MNNKKIRTRYAPSPTGYFHVGGLRTALYAYLFAKQNNGTFFLRVEDTDQTREVQGAVDNLLKSLKMVGLDPEEGVLLDSDGKASEKGDFGPYTQSQRLKIYQKYAQELIDKGLAYYCFCTSERLDEVRKTQEANKQPTRYDRHCRDLSVDEAKERIAKGEKHVIRMKIPDNEIIEFEDLIRGAVKFNSNEIDDQILMKSDGFPTYHLAHVVDDHLMETSHIIRGEEWLPSTPKHLLLFKFFGWEAPEYAHLSLLLNPDKTKLSKRQGDVAVEDYIAKGYLPEAIVNFVALLGWNPGTEQEIFSMEELIKEFSLEKVHKTGAIFDVKKLDWMNGEYIKKMDFGKFKELAMPFFSAVIASAAEKSLSDEQIDKILNLEKQRIMKLSEIGESIDFLLSNDINYDPQILVWKKSDKEFALKNLQLLSKELKNIDEKNWTAESLEKVIIEFIKNNNLTNGEVLWPMRVALTGQEKSPTPFEVADMLEKEKSLERIDQAIKSLK